MDYHRSIPGDCMTVVSLAVSPSDSAKTAAQLTAWCRPSSSRNTTKPPISWPARASSTWLGQLPAMPSDQGAQHKLAAGSPHYRGVGRLQTVEAAQAADGTAEKEFDISNP